MEDSKLNLMIPKKLILTMKLPPKFVIFKFYTWMGTDFYQLELP